MSTVNDQASDAVTETLYNVIGQAPSQSFGMLDTVMSETIGMLMHGSVNGYQNSTMTANAATTTTCAKILSVPLPNTGSPTPTSPPTSPGSPSGSPTDGPDLAANISNNFTKAQSAMDSLNQDLKQAEVNEKTAKNLLQKLADMARNAR